MGHSHTHDTAKTATRAGVWLSALCLVHCLALPVLAAVAPTVSANVAGAEWVESAFLLLTLGLLVLMVLPDTLLRHKRPLPLLIGALGLIASVAGHWQEGGALHLPLMVAGSVCVAFAFYRNHRMAYH